MPRSDPVAEKGPADGAGEVEDVDDGVPAEALPEGGVIAEDKGDPLRGVDAEGVGGEVIDEPDEGDDSEAKPVEPRRTYSPSIFQMSVCKMTQLIGKMVGEPTHLITSHQGVFVSFIVSRLNSSGSWSFSRK